MKRAKSLRLFILFTLYFVLALGAYIFFYLHINNTAKAAAETRSEIERLGTQNNQMQNLRASVRDTEAGRAQINNFFVDSGSIIEFLETVESLGDIAQVEIDVRSINETETRVENIKNLSLSIDFSGVWSETHHFLVLLESIPIIMTVDQLTLRELPSDDGSSWRGSVNIRTLQLKK